MTTKIDTDIINKWAAAYCGGDAAAFDALVFRHVSDRTIMPDVEREPMEREMARRQFEQNPDAETVDSAIIVEVLAEGGFHPAFEHGGLISAQAALEALQQAPRPAGL